MKEEYKMRKIVATATILIVVIALTIAYAHQESSSDKMENMGNMSNMMRNMMMGDMIGEGHEHQGHSHSHQMMRQMCRMMMGNMMGDMMEDHDEMMMNCPMMKAQREENFYLGFKEKIGLSEAQVKALQAIKAAYQKSRLKTNADLRVAELELNELLEKNDADLSQIEAKVKSIEELRAYQKFAKIKALKEAEKVLTQEQKTKLKSLQNSSSKEDSSHSHSH